MPNTAKLLMQMKSGFLKKDPGNKSQINVHDVGVLLMSDGYNAPEVRGVLRIYHFSCLKMEKLKMKYFRDYSKQLYPLPFCAICKNK